MRRITFTILVSLALLLAACGGASTGNSGGNTAGSASPSPTATTAPTATVPSSTPTSSASGAATISMAGFSFSGNTTVTIKAGQSVTFSDPASTGGTHDLVTGTQGQFSAAAGAPSEFASRNGILFSPGDSKTITFPNAGTFGITCTIHPRMQATITVTS